MRAKGTYCSTNIIMSMLAQSAFIQIYIPYIYRERETEREIFGPSDQQSPIFTLNLALILYCVQTLVANFVTLPSVLGR